MIENVMDTPMPDSSSKLSDIDYTAFLKKDSHHLSCPECEIIPALFIEKDSKNLFSISSGCENKHVIHSISVRDFYKKSLTKNEINEKETITLCQEHNEKYDSFCKSCHKNICSQCANSMHQNHNMIKFVDLQPSKEDITNLKNSIKNEIKITSEFLTLEFNRWIDELKDKFEDLLELISYKNKLYNQVISNYESGNLNYQIIHNMKIVLKEQITRNPISKNLATLLKIITSIKKEEKDDKHLIFNDEKNQHFLHILNIENASLNSNSNNNNNNNNNNGQSMPPNTARASNNLRASVFPSNPEKFLSDFINNPIRKNQMPNQNQNNYNTQYNNQNNYGNNNMLKKSISASINVGQLLNNNNNQNLNMNQNIPGNSYGNNNNNYINRNNNNYNNNNAFYNVNKEGACEFQLTGKRLKKNIDLKEFIHSVSPIKLSGTQKLAVGLENGIVKVFSFNDTTGDLSSDFDIKEHDKAITAVLGLNNGNLITCSQDKTLKVINFPQKSLVSIFKNYSVMQVLQCKPDSFYFTCIIEMSDGNIVVADWNNIIMWKPFKKDNSNEYEYREINQIVINTRTTALLQVDDGVFISAHYNINIINFYDTKRQRTRTLKDIRCSDDAPNCLSIISTRCNGYEDDGDNSDKVVLVGGIQCLFFLSVKYQSLIYKLYLPEVTYLRIIVNTGVKFFSNSIICSGLFKQYSNDLVLFNIINQGGYNKFGLREIFRLSEVDKGSINSLVLLKKANSNDSSGIVMITGGNEKVLKVYD